MSDPKPVPADDKTPSAADESLLGAKGDPVEGPRDIPNGGGGSDADKEAQKKARDSR